MTRASEQVPNHSPGRSIVYVSCSKGRRIDVMALDVSTGSLECIDRIALPGDGMPLAIAPAARRLYAAVAGNDETGGAPQYLTFTIEPATGLLAPLGAVPAPGRMSHIAIDRSGRHLLGASVSNSLIASHRIKPDGKLTSEPAEVHPVAAKAHHISTDATNRFAFVPNLAGDFVSQLRFSAETGHFADHEPDTLPGTFPGTFNLPAGAAPRHIAHHPKRAIAYLLREEDGLISTLKVDTSRGSLVESGTNSYLPDGFNAEPWGAQILTDPPGRWLYASERSSSTIAVFEIDFGTGSLTRAGTFETADCPRNFTIDESGTWLLVAGEKSNTVVAHRIDRQTGALDRVASAETGGGPVWIETMVLQGERAT